MREESGSFEGGVWTVRGHLEWLGPEGKKFAQDYIADDKGYRVKSVPVLTGKDLGTKIIF